MLLNVKELLRKIDDLRAAAVAARIFARTLDSFEARESIFRLAAEWEAQAAKEEERVLQHSREIENQGKP